MAHGKKGVGRGWPFCITQHSWPHSTQILLGKWEKRRRSRGREYGGRFHTHKKRDKREVVSVARKEAREVREAVGRKIHSRKGITRKEYGVVGGMERVKRGEW